MTPERDAINYLMLTRKIRACEGEAAAQLLLEHAISKACAEQREQDAKIAENGECDQTEYRCCTVERIAKSIREGK